MIHSIQQHLFTTCALVSLLLCLVACSDSEITFRQGTYKGSLREGKPHGYGVYQRGTYVYEGEWQAGLPHGTGVERNDSLTYRGSFFKGKRNGHGVLYLHSAQTHYTYAGEFLQGKRQGNGTYTLPNQTSWSGVWHADTISYGTLHDSTGVYTGSFNKEMKPEGFGKYQTPKLDNYYEGHWKNGKQQGFGYNLSVQKGVECGYWKNGKFLGERMYYTSSRVYGIDISHYQHGGRPTRRFKGYPINWKALRIVHLGSNTKNSIGAVDYPVSFCYIKSTQGVKLWNPYYHQDARNGRGVGIKVGAYHFMDPTSGTAQAKWFLQKTSIAASDLAPMLDVELTSLQIKKMGGDSVMLSEMLKWLRHVEKATGKRPILYLSQTFINKYMKNAPKELLEYKVWIARYSEYRPYVSLQYWQLTPYGRVKGIRGDVDINVFNGSMEQFKRFTAGEEIY